MRVALIGKTVTDQELRTLATVAEGIINSRPISYRAKTPEDFEPLTPAHFLMGKGVENFEAPPVLNRPYKYKDKWYASEARMDTFWQRFNKEVVPTFQEYRKWTKKYRNIRVGDIVLLLDNAKWRGHYPLGKVVEVYPSKEDGLVRNAAVQEGNKIKVRPIQKLALILEDESAEALSEGEEPPEDEILQADTN